MLRYIFDKRIHFGQYNLSLNCFNRYLNKRIIFSILVLLSLFFVLIIWGEWFLMTRKKNNRTINKNTFL